MTVKGTKTQVQNSNDHKQIIQQGFDTVAKGYDHPSLSFFPETAKRLLEHLQLNPTDNLLDVCTGTVNRDDYQLKLTLSDDYHFDRTFEFTSKYQYIDNESSVDRYHYDKSIIRVGLSKCFDECRVK
jgi:hypothetical protein